jgi:hypothetical protein
VHYIQITTSNLTKLKRHIKQRLGKVGLLAGDNLAGCRSVERDLCAFDLDD